MFGWFIDAAGTSQNMSVRASSRAQAGRTNRIYVRLSGLMSVEDYLGGVIYKDQNG
jgi:hypothetical protein